MYLTSISLLIFSRRNLPFIHSILIP